MKVWSRHSLTALLLILTLLGAGVGRTGDIVWCIAADGEAHTELFTGFTGHCDSAAAAHEHDEERVGATLAEDCCGPCLDLQITRDNLLQRLSSLQHFIAAPAGLIVADLHHPALVRFLAAALHVNQPPLPVFHLTAIRATVLLI